MLETTGAVTAQHDFFEVNGKKLFSVNAGIPLEKAFEELDVLIGQVRAVLNDGHLLLIEQYPHESVWSAAKLLDFTQALAQSIQSGYMASQASALAASAQEVQP